MARINVNPKVYEAMKERYSSEYDGSSKKLWETLNKAVEDAQISGNDLISEKTIRNFFDGNDQSKRLEATLNALCKALLDYESYVAAEKALSPKAPEIVNNTAISLVPAQNLNQSQYLTQEWLQEYAQVIDQDCQIRILDMRKPRNIGDVYVEVLLLDTPTLMRHHQKTIDELLQFVEHSESEEDNEIVPKISENKASGFEVVAQSQRLMILGRPGAGKTTFLKKIAMVTMSELLESGDVNQNPLPIYIRLKDFSEAENQESLMDAITEKVPLDGIKTLLEQGQCLILLDALDEVINQEVERVYTSIDRFVKQYHRNKFIVTCRNAAREYFLEGFTLVEVAPFKIQQIEQFVHLWFQAEPETGKRFLADINSNKPVQRLAKKPLLLTFLCLTFDEIYSLAADPYGLYSDIIDVCSRRWDASRRIHREMPYAEGLTQERLLDMLSKIAYDSFIKDRPQYLWKRWGLEEEIATFTQRIFGFEAENKSISSRQVLNAIEANTGIIIEEVRDVYKFAHLTFREYFAARHIALSGDSELIKQVVSKHLLNRQWREIFRIIPGRLRNANEFLTDIFWEINKIAKNEKIQLLLKRIHEATQKHGVSSCGWRAMYLAVVRDAYYVGEHGVQINFPWARRLAIKVKELNGRRKQIVLPTPLSRVTIYLLITYAVVYQQNTPFPQSDIFDSVEQEKVAFFSQEPFQCLEKAIEQSAEVSKELTTKLKALKNKLASGENKDSKREVWLKELVEIMRDTLDIGRLFDFTKEDIEAMNNYLYACNLLVDCIGGDSMASPRLRNQIIDNLLLPVDKISDELVDTSDLLTISEK